MVQKSLKTPLRNIKMAPNNNLPTASRKLVKLVDCGIQTTRFFMFKLITIESKGIKILEACLDYSYRHAKLRNQ